MSRQRKLFWTTTALVFGLVIGASHVSAQNPPKDFIVPELKGSPQDLEKLEKLMPPRPVVKNQVELPRYPDPKSRQAQKKKTKKIKKIKTAKQSKPAPKTTRAPQTLKIDGGKRYSYQNPKPTRLDRPLKSKATSHPVYVFERRERTAQPVQRYSYKQSTHKPTFTHTRGATAQVYASKTCYTKLHTPAQYKTVSERVLVKEARVRKHVIPAQYREVERRVITKPEQVKIKRHAARYGYVKERVLVKPERVHVRQHPAKVRHVTERVLVSPAQKRVHITPPEYGYVNRRVQIAPATSHWTVSQRRGHCGTHPVYCHVQTPPQYVDQTQRVLMRPGQQTVQNIPARYQNVRRQVLVKPAYNERIVSSAVYKTIKRKVVLSPAWDERLISPAKYKIVRERVLVHPAREEIHREPAIYKTITKNVLVSREKTHYQRVHVNKGGC